MNLDGIIGLFRGMSFDDELMLILISRNEVHFCH